MNHPLAKSERYGIELHNIVMLACRLHRVGWERADKIAKEVVHRAVFTGLPNDDHFEDYWERLLLRSLAEALNEADARERSLR